MNENKIGAFIASERRKKNLTQKDLADMLYVTDRAVSKWERGLSYPDIMLLEKISDILGISVSELLHGERIENISKDQVDILVKDSIIIFKKINKKKIFKKIILTCVGTFLFVILGYGVYIGIAKEFFHGNVPIAPGMSVEVPTKKSNEAKQNIKKFIKAFAKKDYDVIDKMLEKYLIGKDNKQENIAKYNEYLKDYYDTFTIDSYETYNDCYYNGRYYVVEYTIYLKYRGTRFITYVQLGYDNGNIYLHALGYENEDVITEGLIGGNNSVLMQKLLNVFSDSNVKTNLGLDLVD